MYVLILDFILIQYIIEWVVVDGGELDYMFLIVILNESQLNMAEEQVIKFGFDVVKFVVEFEG